ncbi:MAG: M20 family metallo-hydrolase [Phycisphaerales bacterium]
MNNFSLLSTVGLEKDGGFSRLAFSDTDWQARRMILKMMETAGLTIRIDEFGNIIGRREGLCRDSSVVMLGSHIDSVPHGGNFDGIVGVLGAIEVINCLKDKNIKTYHPIEVVVFMAEESSRFGTATLGSKAFCGELTYKDIERLKDQQGISLPAALRKRGLIPENVEKACYDKKNIKAFLELHIEQGKVLETTKTTIGVVSAIAAPTRLRVIIRGNADHSGATPMSMRKDALAAAAEIILFVEAIACHWADKGIVGTTGMIKAYPGVMNVIPGVVELGVDIRGTCYETKQKMLRELNEAIAALKLKRDVNIEFLTISDETPVQLSREMTDFLSTKCSENSYSYKVMPSGAGHDSMHLAAYTHTGMLFIPCRGGISHNPAEWADTKDIVAGTHILLTSIIDLAEKSFIWKTEDYCTTRK